MAKSQDKIVLISVSGETNDIMGLYAGLTQILEKEMTIISSDELRKTGFNITPQTDRMYSTFAIYPLQEVTLTETKIPIGTDITDTYSLTKKVGQYNQDKIEFGLEVKCTEQETDGELEILLKGNLTKKGLISKLRTEMDKYMPSLNIEWRSTEWKY